MTSDPRPDSAAWFANAYLLLVLTSLFWAGNAIAGKLAAGVLTPVTLTFVRWLCACALIGWIARHHVRRDLSVIRRHWRLLFALGSLGFCAFNLLIYLALHYTTAINITIEQSCLPVLIIALNYLAFRQKITSLQVIGIVISIAGVAVTATHGDPFAVLASGVNRGDALMMGAIALYGGYTVALRYRPAMHWLSMLFALAVSALIFATPFYLWEGVTGGFVMPGPHGWAIIAYTAVFPSTLAQLFFLRGVELIGPNRAAVLINLVPIFGAGLAVVLLGEAFRLYHLAGLVLVLGGIALAEYGTQSRSDERDAIR